ncbi:hypothetical protein K450DRAFT_233416, partial [Umbelopsis ramanniana AG]
MSEWTSRRLPTPCVLHSRDQPSVSWRKICDNSHNAVGLKPYQSKHGFRVFSNRLVSHRLQRRNYWQHLCNQFSPACLASILDFF